MQQKLINDLLKLIGGTLVILGAAFLLLKLFQNGSNDIETNKSGKIEELEVQLSNFYIDSNKQNFLDSINYPITNAYSKIIFDSLLSKISNPLYSYKLYITNESFANAFCAPGGVIVVTKGMLQLIDEPEELAAVLAHEIGHAELKHFRKRISRILGTTIIASVLTGGDPGTVAVILRDLNTLHYSRKQETEADEFAVDLLTILKIDPEYLTSLFNKLVTTSQNLDISFEWLSTHPDMDKRISQIEEKLQNIEYNFYFKNIDWNQLKSEIN